MSEFWQGFAAGIGAWSLVIVSSNITLFWLLCRYEIKEKDKK